MTPRRVYMPKGNVGIVGHMGQEQEIRRLQTMAASTGLGHVYRVVLPAQWVRSLGWEASGYVRMTLRSDGVIELAKVEG